MEKESETKKAKRFIEENIRKMRRRDIVKHLYNTTTLSNSTIQCLTTEIINKTFQYPEVKEVKKKPKEAPRLYKGKPRSFFYFDDSNLYNH